jgi:hypothetical protein
VLASDCVSSVCTGTPLTCKTETCTDLVKNGTETDVDCGGASCAKCGTGKTCNGASDCVSAVCTGTPATCQAATCTDLVKNGNESDIDCGGATCSKCPAGKTCGGASDCQSGVCSGTCQAPTCADLVKNGTETDVDCGGSCSAKCANGRGCSVSADCQSNYCGAGTCAVPPDPAQYNFETDLQGWISHGEIALQQTTSMPYQGSGAQRLNFNVTVAATADSLINNPPIPAGSVITFHIWIPSGSTMSWIQPFASESGQADAGGDRWASAFSFSWTVNAWNTFQVTVPADWAPCKFIGVQFYMGGVWTGTMYIDSVSW